MAHPLKGETNASRQSKLRSMTEGYGLANPTANQNAKVEQFKSEGPEGSIGFGADDSRPNMHAARRIRKPAGGNGFATYKKGGRVKHRDGGGGVADANDIEQADINEKLAQRKHGGRIRRQEGNGTEIYPGPVKMGAKYATKSSEPSPTPIDNRARGGRTKKKGDTHVNIMIGSQHPQPPMGLPLGGNPALPPPAPPMGKPPMGPPGAAMGAPPMGGPPMPGAMPPGMPPPGMMPPRKHGGRIVKKSHSDEKQDLSLIRKTVKADALKPHGSMRAAGGRLHMTAGTYSGEGRLQQAHHNKRIAPQKV